MENQFRIREVPMQNGAPPARFVIREDDTVVAMCGIPMDATLVANALNEYVAEAGE